MILVVDGHADLQIKGLPIEALKVHRRHDHDGTNAEKRQWILFALRLLLIVRSDVVIVVCAGY